MKTLVIGAGAIGGYFGGRLLEAGRNVTFLVRPGRAARLAEAGLVIQSPAGNLHVPSPPALQADALDDHFDLILLSCKAYDLDDAIRAFAPAVGPHTIILPLLNGMRHLERLDHEFGAPAVLGGLGLISSTLDAEGRILHLNDTHGLTYGARNAGQSAKARAVEAEFAGANFIPKLSDTILQEMWEKWVFIATVAGITCLMRATIGDIVAAGGGDLTTRLLDECAAIARDQNFAPRAPALQQARAMFTTPGSLLTASMLRDVEGNGHTEAEHLLGDLMRRGGAQENPSSILRTAYLHVAAYEVRRARLAWAGQSNGKF
jgi:2-dehydropantoate 2-reductase